MPVLNQFHVDELEARKAWTWRIKLYSDDITPTYDTDPTTLTEITDSGYSAQIESIGNNGEIPFSVVVQVGDDVYMESASPVRYDYNATTPIYVIGVTYNKLDGSGDHFHRLNRVEGLLPSPTEPLDITLRVSLR